MKYFFRKAIYSFLFKFSNFRCLNRECEKKRMFLNDVRRYIARNQIIRHIRARRGERISVITANGAVLTQRKIAGMGDL